MGTRGFCIGASRYPEAKTEGASPAPAILCRARDEEAVGGQNGHFFPSHQFRTEILDLGQIRANPKASRANRPSKWLLKGKRDHK